MKIFEDKCTKFSLRDCDFRDYEIALALVQGASVVNEEKVLEGFVQISASVYIDIDVRIGDHWRGAGRRW